MEPDTRPPVLIRVNDLLGLKRRWSLYSVGPSCGSASRLVTIISDTALLAGSSSNPAGSGEGESSALAPRRGVDVLGVCHGDDTLGGSGSNVKMDAILKR